MSGREGPPDPVELDDVVTELAEEWTRGVRSGATEAFFIRRQWPELARHLDDLVDGRAELADWRGW